MITQLTVKEKDSSFLVGRDIEIMSVIETLLRVEKPNVILTGEAGVGKTALVRHLAYLIANELVPEELRGYTISEVNLNDLIAGDGYRGVFEKKCQDLVNSAVVKGKAIIFMDEIHVMENLGKMQNGQTPGFGNMLKPYLTGGNIRIIGATTSDEYNAIQDKALVRRFRRIMINEPNEEIVKKIIVKCIDKYNTRKIPVNDKQIVDKVFNASALFSGYNPDKAVDMVDILFAKTRLFGIEKLTGSIVTKYLNDIVNSKQIQQPTSIAQV